LVDGNHKWALVAWERQRVAGKLYVLLHADFHWDGVYYFGPDGSSNRAAGPLVDSSTFRFRFRSIYASVRSR